MSATYSSAEEALVAFANASESATVATSASFTAACLMDAHSVLADSGMTALAVAATTALLAATKACSRRNPGAAEGSAAKRKTKPTVDEGGTQSKDADAPQVEDTSARTRKRAGGAARQQRDAGSSAATQQQQHAKRKARFLEAWWASCSPDERTAALAGLQFALKRELERREEIRLAHIGTNPIVPAPKAP